MIQIPASILRAAFAPLNKTIGKGGTLPVTSTIRVERAGNTVTLTATNFDQWLSFSHEVEKKPLTLLAQNLAAMRWKREAQIFLVPREAVRNALKAAKNGNITLDASFIAYDLAGQTVTVPHAAIDAAEFPQPPPFTRIHPAVPLDMEARNAILGAIPSMSDDESRFILNGVLLHGTDNDNPAPPCAVSTDGRRLYLCRASALGGLIGDAVVPSSALELLGTPALIAQESWSLQQPEHDVECKGEDGKPALRTDRTHLHFAAGPWALTTKLVEGNFPNYKQVIPAEDFGIPVVLDASAHTRFCAILDQLPPLKEKNALRLGFHPGHIEMRDDSSNITANVAGVASSLPLNIAFNRAYFRDALRIGPGTFRLESDRLALRYDAGNATCVLMPLGGSVHIRVPDAERDAAEAVWMNKPVTAKKGGPFKGTGRVVSLVREYRTIVAEVMCEERTSPMRVSLDAIQIVEKPAKPEPKKGKKELQAA